MKPSTLIRHAKIVTDQALRDGWVGIQNGRIAEVSFDAAATPQQAYEEVLDAAGAYLLPGVIDTHVHFREPGLTHKADFASEGAAALWGGVTTVADMPNVVPQTTTLEALREKKRLASARCPVACEHFFGATVENAAHLDEITRQEACGIKLFMGSSTGGMLVDQGEALHEVFRRARLPIVAHCEATDIINSNMQRAQALWGADPDVRHHPEIRSEEACFRSTETAVRLAKEYDARLHVAHITTARELALFRPSLTGDERITAEVCVPHLLFCDEDYEPLGTRIKCNPAVKTRADRDALRQALTTGHIFSIATDHAPHLLEEKAGGCAKAVSGMPMVQFSLLSMLELVGEGVLSLERMVTLMCHHPARLLGLADRGHIREGLRADLVLVRPCEPWTLRREQILSKCGWSPLEGKSFSWRIEKVFSQGA